MLVIKVSRGQGDQWVSMLMEGPSVAGKEMLESVSWSSLQSPPVPGTVTVPAVVAVVVAGSICSSTCSRTSIARNPTAKDLVWFDYWLTFVLSVSVGLVVLILLILVWFGLVSIR